MSSPPAASALSGCESLSQAGRSRSELGWCNFGEYSAARTSIPSQLGWLEIKDRRVASVRGRACDRGARSSLRCRPRGRQRVVAAREYQRYKRTSRTGRSVDSSNGTLVDGVPVGGKPVTITRGVDRPRRILVTFCSSHPQGSRSASAQATSDRDISRRRWLDDRSRTPQQHRLIWADRFSRHHAQVEGHPPVVSDLGSRFGIRLGDRRVKQHRLSPGDEIGIDAFLLVFDGEFLTRR